MAVELYNPNEGYLSRGARYASRLARYSAGVAGASALDAVTSGYQQVLKDFGTKVGKGTVEALGRVFTPARGTPAYNNREKYLYPAVRSRSTPQLPYSMPPKYSRRRGYGRRSYRRRSRWGYRKAATHRRNTYGFMQSQRIPRAVKTTLVPPRMQATIHHYLDTGSNAFHFPTLLSPVGTSSWDWMDCGDPLGNGIIPQQFQNLSKIYQRYLVVWCKLTITYPAPHNSTVMCEELYYCPKDASQYTPSHDFYTFMTAPHRQYVMIPPTEGGITPVKKITNFLRPNRLDGVDWRMYAGDPNNWGTLGDGTSTNPGGAGSPPTNAYPLKTIRHSVANGVSNNSGPVRWHWSAKIQVWQPDEAWVNGGLVSQAAALQALRSGGAELQPFEENPLDDNKEEAPLASSSSSSSSSAPLKINVLKAKKKN